MPLLALAQEPMHASYSDFHGDHDDHDEQGWVRVDCAHALKNKPAKKKGVEFSKFMLRMRVLQAKRAFHLVEALKKNDTEEARQIYQWALDDIKASIHLRKIGFDEQTRIALYSTAITLPFLHFLPALLELITGRIGYLPSWTSVSVPPATMVLTTMGCAVDNWWYSRKIRRFFTKPFVKKLREIGIFIRESEAMSWIEQRIGEKPSGGVSGS